jgi:hypothetical protein
VFFTCLGYPSEASNLGGVDYGTLNNFIVKATIPHIRHGTDTIVTPYDTGGIEIIPDNLVYEKHRVCDICGPCPRSDRLKRGATFLYGLFDIKYSSFYTTTRTGIIKLSFYRSSRFYNLFRLSLLSYYIYGMV